MTQPRLPAITPSETVHIPPPEKPAVRRLSQPQAEAILGGAANLILAKVALALGGIDVLGVKPFAFLTKWGQDIQAKARAAFDVATSSQAVANSSEASTAIAIGQSATTQTNVQTTWDTLWEANTGLTATTPKTVTDVKTTQANVRTNATNGANGATTNAGNIQSTWNNIYDGTFYQAVPGATRSLSDVYDATYYSAYTANGADEQSDTNSGNIQLTWNEIYFAAGGTGPTGTSKSLQDAKTALSGVTENAATGAEYSQETIDAIYNTTYGTNTSGKSPSDIIPALEETVAEKDEQFAAGSNGMLSPDFENTIIARHKIGTSGEYSTEQKRSGARSWKWVQAAGQDSGLYFAPTRLNRRFTVRPAATADTGDWWYVEAWLYRATASTGTVRFGARWYNTLTNNQVSDYTEAALSSIPQNTWMKFSSYIQVPEGRDAGEFYIQTNAGTTTSAVFYLDDVVVREVTDAKEAADAARATSDYVDDTQQAGSNLVLSPGFEKITVPRLHVGTPGASTGYSTVVKKSGSYSYRYQQAAGAASGLYLAPTPTSAVITASVGDRFDVEAVVFSAHSSSPTGAIRVGVEWLNNGVALSPAQESYREWTLTGSSTDTDLVLPRNNWKTLKHTTVACPSGANGGRFFVYNTSATATSNLTYVDDVVVREVTAAATAQGAAESAQQSADDTSDYVDDTQQAGSNLVLSPGFEKITVPRLYVGSPGASTGYSTVQTKSGAYAFRYQQAAAAATGLYLAPTSTSAVITANPGDRFDVEAAVFSAHSTSPTGAIRVGVEWLLNGSALSPAQEKYREWTLAVTSTDTALGRNTWKTLTYVTPACPAGANGARFFVYSTSATATSNLTYVDDVVVREVTLQQDTNDAVGQGLGGTSTPPGGGLSPSDLGSLAGDLNRNVGDLGAAVSEIVKDTAGSALSGKAFSVNFGTLADSSNFPATFTATRFTTSGTHGGAQVSGGRLTYVPSSANAMDNGRSLGLYVTDHDMQYQRVGVTLTSVLPYLVSNSRGGNWIFARASTDASVNGLPDSCVYARLYYPNILAGLSNAAQLVLGYTSGGSSGTPVATVNFTYTVGSTYWLEAGDPATQNTNTYRVLKDNLDLTGWVSLGFPSLTGTRSGLGLEVSSDGLFRYDPARVASWVAYDNAPAATLGEGLRAEGGTGLPVSTSATVANFGSGLFGNARSTAGLTWSTINNAATASVAGWYAVNASVYTATTTSTTFQLVLAVNETGSADNDFVNHTWGDPVSGTGAKAATVHGLVYLDKGGSVKVRYLLASASITTAGGADAVRTSFNMAFANNTLPTNP